MKAKRIYLQLLPPTRAGVPDALDYKKLLEIQLSESPVGGFTVGQMKTRFELIESLDGASEFWDIDFKSWDQLIKELEAKKWGLVSKNIVKFINDIRDAQDAISGEIVEFPAKAEEIFE